MMIVVDVFFVASKSNFILAFISSSKAISSLLVAQNTTLGSKKGKQ